MQPGKIFPVTSVDGTDFIVALAQNAAMVADLTLSGALGAGGVTTARIVSLKIISSDNLAWEVQVFGAHDGANADPNKDTFHGRWTFAAADAIQIGNLWYYYIDGLDIPYHDQDLAQHLGNVGTAPANTVPQFHVQIVNRSAGAKASYGAGGHFKLVVHLAPTAQGS